MSKHTPGPWTVAVEDGSTYLYAPSIDGLSTRETLMGDTPYYPFIDFTEADWNLVAAAPDLLEALKETWRVVDSAGLTNLVYGVQVGMLSWLEKANTAKDLSITAIAKAEGEMK